MLLRQIRRCLGPEQLTDPRVAALLADVDRAYRQSDGDRAMLERSLELSSDELLAANEDLRGSQRELEARVAERTAELETAGRALAAEMQSRLEAQETLTREEARYRLFLERIPAITYVAEPGDSGRWLYVSPQVEPILGYTVAEWLADPYLWFERIHADDRQAALAEENRCLGARDQFVLEYRMLARDGRVVWVRDGAVFLPAEAGEPDRLHGVMLDISERRLLEEQLTQAQKAEAIGQLAGGVAHDFNNLLTAITGYAELLRRRLAATGDGAPEIEEILRAGERATRVTGKLLAFGRRQRLDLRILDLNRLLIEIENLLRRLIGERIQLALELAPGAIATRADPTEIEQVVMNLVVNARDALPEGGRIRLATAKLEVTASGRGAIAGLRPGPYVELEVSDDGIGMDAETRRRLFEPFFTTKPVGQGTGLGLATAFGIVRQVGGTILVASAPGKGSQFRVLLPLVVGEETARVVRPRSSSRPGRAQRVLLVEDDPAVLGLAAALLGELGYQVSTASDGVEALDLVEREGLGQFDLLWTDVVMPRLGGAELARRLRARRPDLPVLFASGYAPEEADIAQLLDERCIYLQKPFSSAVVGEALERLFSR